MRGLTGVVAITATVALYLSGCGSHMYHRVDAGDTLYSISWQHGFDYNDVARWNGLEPPYTIRAGQIIKFKADEQRTGAAQQGWTLLSKPTATSHSDPRRAVTSTQQPRTAAKVTAAAKADVSRTRVDTGRSSSTAALAWAWPADGKVNTRGATQNRVNSRGVEIQGNVGQPVRAAAQGKVVYSGNALKGYGNLVIIKHNADYLSAYANNQSLFVREGEQVNAGQRIAAMGRNVNDHAGLYFEIRRDGKPVDPLRYLPARR